MQNNPQPDTVGLKAVLTYNEKVQPNDDFLNTLKTNMPQFLDKDGNFKKDKFDDELKQNNITEARDGYKLSFIGKDYARLQVGRKSETMIVPDCKHNAMPENKNSGNVFITGDNIDAIRHLVNAYENQIKLIYIDPPYNTGEEFVYYDKFEYNDEKLKTLLKYTDEEIARLKSIQGKSSHSAWLTFMYPRLKIAQRLLKDDGVIFISIDDNEQANLKLLMDEIFGESNFLAEISWQGMDTIKNDAKYFSENHEYILCYSKIISNVKLRGAKRTEEHNKVYKNYDNDPNGPYLLTPLNAKSGNEKNNYEYTFSNGTKYRPPQGTYHRFSRETLAELESKNCIYFGNKKGAIPQKKTYLSEVSEYIKLTTFWDYKFAGSTRQSNNELADLLGKGIFDNPKPTKLIKMLIESISDLNSFILDFFAGSSTTAHAVMQLNAEDGGNRKFIMVQLDEKTKADSEARKAGYNTIDEIARKRIELAGEKILKEYESDLVKQTNGWDKDIGFKHYRLITPDVKTLEKINEFNPEETNLIADDMIKPFEYKKTETCGLDTILTTWLIDDGFRFDTPVEEIIFGNYKAHYVHSNARLYLINMSWDTKALMDMLNQIGKNELPVKTIVVYPYSFEFEAMRELKSNIKTNLDDQINIIERF